MQSVSNTQIEARAYQLWEEEGRPTGRDLDHWSKAASELITNGATNGKTKAPAKKAAAKAKAEAEPAVTAKPKRKTAKASK